MFTWIRLLLLIHHIISSLFFLSNFQHWNILSYFSRELWGLEETYTRCIPESGCCCLFVPFFFFFLECRTPEREVRGSRPTAAVLCPWARHFTPRKYWLITQEAMAPSRHDWKIVDWEVKPQHNQPTFIFSFSKIQILKFSSHFSQELWGREGWNLVHT